MSGFTETRETPSFSRFNMKANKKIHQSLVDQHEQDMAYIAELEKILKEREIEIPSFVREIKKRIESRDRAMTDRLMADGSLASLTKAVERNRSNAQLFEVNVQYRNLSFWNEVPPKKIPTVGSSFRNLFLCGSGKKQRVDIIKDLTGKILPKRMTLVMGPPGCGKLYCFFF